MRFDKATSDKTIEVYSGTLWEAEMIRSLLNDAQISNFMKNHLLQSNLYDPITSEGAKVIVLKKDSEEALCIVNSYRNNLKK